MAATFAGCFSYLTFTSVGRKFNLKANFPLTGQSIRLEATCTRPCPAAVGCVLMASCISSEVITPGGTQTGYSSQSLKWEGFVKGLDHL